MCARCVHALGRVAAGRFWCSYARVSLTQTAPVRPRGWVHACARLCARLCVRSYRRVVAWCAVVWRGVVVCCHTSLLFCSYALTSSAAYLFSLAVLSYLFSLVQCSLASFRYVYRI